MALNRTNFNLLVDGNEFVGTLWDKAHIKDVILDPVDAALANPTPVDITITATAPQLNFRPNSTRLYQGIILFQKNDGTPSFYLGNDIANTNVAIFQLMNAAGVALLTATQTTVTINVPVGGDLKFTDASFDIGKSGATRPRDLFLSRTLTMGGMLTVNGFGTHSFSADGPGSNRIVITNTSTGNSDAQLGLTCGSTNITLYSFGQGYSSSGPYIAGAGCLRGDANGGLSIIASHASGVIRFYSGGTAEQARLTAGGELLIGAVTPVQSSKVLIACNNGAFNPLVVQTTAAPGNSFVIFVNSAGATAGGITHTASTTVAYGTASDRRLKIDGGAARDLTALRAVVVHDFIWKDHGTPDRGVFAQDTARVFPRAIVSGSDGDDLSRPWMADYSKFVPDLIVGWQQHDETLRALAAKLAQLDKRI